MLHRTLNHKSESLDAWRRILRVEPAFVVDANQYTPSFVQAFEVFRKELTRARKVQLEVTAQVPNAEVLIDGRLMGKAPLRLQLLAGDYKVTVAADDRTSFAHVAKLVSKPELVQVDLAYEGALSSTTPLCVNAATEPEAKTLAMKLAASVSVERVVVLRLSSKPNDPAYFRALIMQGSEEERSGGVRQPSLRDLAEFLVTGKVTEQLVVGPGKPPDVKRPLDPKPVEVKPAPAPVEVKVVETKPIDTPVAPKVQPAVEAKVVSPRADVPVAHTVERGPVPRIVGLVVAGLGVAVAIGGVAVYASGAQDRTALANTLTAEGHFKLGGVDEGFAAAAAVEKNRTLYGALFGIGGGLAIAGALIALLLPPSDLVVVSTLTPGQVGLGVAKTF